MCDLRTLRSGEHLVHLLSLTHSTCMMDAFEYYAYTVPQHQTSRGVQLCVKFLRNCGNFPDDPGNYPCTYIICRHPPPHPHTPYIYTIPQPTNPQLLPLIVCIPFPYPLHIRYILNMCGFQTLLSVSYCISISGYALCMHVTTI